MKLKLLLIACSSCLSIVSHAQTPGDIENVRFEYMEKPVLLSIGGDPLDFVHATYTNMAWGDYNNDGSSIYFTVIKIIMAVQRKLRKASIRITGMVPSTN